MVTHKDSPPPPGYTTVQPTKQQPSRKHSNTTAHTSPVGHTMTPKAHQDLCRPQLSWGHQMCQTQGQPPPHAHRGHTATLQTHNAIQPAAQQLTPRSSSLGTYDCRQGTSCRMRPQAPTHVTGSLRPAGVASPTPATHNSTHPGHRNKYVLREGHRGLWERK